ncbi:sulfate ABC transporter substrate-binding protein [Cohnella cholangitidis]|uniref:Sulfate ABC transporter substrate-binding protein n=1 Tax=Cohnella cholangitidis TaxID=2598458 RepID=A0A7G5C2F5_9BACL|nr:sulfate ABC transporter substrate-binding protein [Cohnella cholangitidis]QMV43389.1 sulfate ABC transporter substrate-binding protein [Cohnella cholangitidis]
MKTGNRNAKLSRKMGLSSLLILLFLSFAISGCGGSDQPSAVTGENPVAASGDVTLVVGAYSVAKDALQDIMPAFKAEWKAKTGQNVVFQESYEASGTQARSIIGGFEADVTLLALEGDMEKLVKAELVSPEWKQTSSKGMVTRSIVVLGTRAGNPLGIKDFEDLTKTGVKVLYPNPKTSGGAQWDINAIYGAGLKKSEAVTGAKDAAAAKKFLEDVHRNIESMDKSGRASMAAFEYGVGDVIVTYENELLARIAQGVEYDIVVPSSTILIENPAAVVDRNADRHGVREAADAFVKYLYSNEAQKLFAEHGFRPVNDEIAAGMQERFPRPPELFTIDYLGGWDEVRETLYSKKGIWYQVLAGQ